MKLDVNDIVGKKFGRLTVLRFDHKEPSILKNGTKNGFKYYYLCKCDCGNTAIVRRGELKTTVSCGCYRKERAYETNFKEDKYTNLRIYKIFQKMKQRCYNKNSTYYKNYGGRGIKICTEWLNNFQLFYDWAINNGYNDILTIDRINVNGNYEPSNCRWVDMKTQSNNKRNNHLIFYKGNNYTLSEISKIVGIKQSTIRARLKKGWSVEKALTPQIFKNQYC